MPLNASHYPIAFRGRATSFTESELPTDFALEMRNRFINAAGGAEKRRGIAQLGASVPGTPNLTGIHELVLSDGTAILMVSGAGRIYKFDSVAETYSQVFSGWDAVARIQSVQMGDKLIFVNGVDRNIFTEDASTFTELQAVIEAGAASSGTGPNELQDSTVTNWVLNTFVNENDILRNLTTGGVAVITAVATTSVAHTAVSANAPGVGGGSAQQASGNRYEIVDGVELNIIPTDGDPDNVATAGAGTNATSIVVSAVADWTATQIRAGDFIRNTTRAALTEVTAVATASLGVAGISGQTSGDALVFIKSAMPVTSRAHVHFGRLYLVDARDKRLVRVSGPNNPKDFTSEAGTVDSNTFKFGELQPEGDAVLDMASFQRFFAIAGRQNVYLFEGTDPIADVSAGPTGPEATRPNFDIIGLFPQGAVSPDGVVSIGNDLIFVTPDGVQSAALAGDASTLSRANLSEPIKTTIRDEIQDTPEAQIIAFHYPRRSWFVVKIGSVLHVFNYTTFFGQGQSRGLRGGTVDPQSGSWSIFDGKFARQNFYFVRRNRDLLCCGPSGRVFIFDNDGQFDDDGENYTTEYQTGWLTMEEPRRGVRWKQGQYIRPILELGADITYTVRAEAGWDSESSDTVTFGASGQGTPIGIFRIGNDSIGGTGIQDEKYPLRWRGKEARITFTTDDSTGPDVLSRFSIYFNMFGRR